jgi:hypothetical protein
MLRKAMKKTTWIGCMCALWVAGAAFSHHSPAVFDQTREITLVGKVTEFRWTNPHSWIALEVAMDNGPSEAWDVELTSPNYLVRAGWKSTTVKPGDEVTIVVNPLRTNERVGKFVSIELPSGQHLTER